MPASRIFRWLGGLAAVSALVAGSWVVGTRYLARQDLAKAGMAYSEATFLEQVCAGNRAATSLFLRAGMDVNVRGADDLTALHCAAGIGLEDIVATLLERNAAVNVRTRAALDTPLHLAAGRGSVPIVNMLLEAGADIDAKSQNGTPLFNAVAGGHADVFEFLIQHGADPRLKNRHGESALHAALRNRRPSTLVDALIEKGVDLNAVGKEGETVLHVAAAGGHLDIVEKLVEHGADVNAVARQGTALMQGAFYPAICRFLLEHGADPNLADADGDTPLMRAAQMRKVEIAEMLLAAGAKAGAARERRDSPLHHAARSGSVEMVTLLIRHGADASAPGISNRTPLHEAVASSGAASLDVVKLLLEWDANVNARDDAGRTPLIEARRAKREVVEALVNQGADIHARDDGGKNVLYWFTVQNSEALGYLVQKGAVADPDDGSRRSQAGGQAPAPAALPANGSQYLSSNARKPGVTTTASGLQYQILRAGAGRKPGPRDTVKVHYIAWLADGRMVDSSYSRDAPTSFQVGNVVKGWTEGLQLMPVGAKYRFVVPPALAYGARGVGARIPPNAVLVYEVELLGIE